MSNCYTPEQIFFQKAFKLLVWLFEKAYGLNFFTQGEVKIMANYTVKDDNPDVGVKVTVVGGDVDSEGQPVPTGNKISISSTDDAVLQVTDNGDGSGNVHFGAPGQASAQYSVTDPAGNILASGSDGFTVTTGDPTAITSVTAAFDGLTPTPPTPPTP